MIDRISEFLERVIPPVAVSLVLVAGFAVAGGQARAAEPIDFVQVESGECLCLGTVAVTFSGHGARHLPATVSRATVESLITANVRANPMKPVGGYWNGWVYAKGGNGITYLIQYGAYRAATNIVNVGTYYPLW